jgi:hypothetical protein
VNLDQVAAALKRAKPEARLAFRVKAETSTLYFCRNVLGMTSSKHWKTGIDEQTTKTEEFGVLSTGPHKEMCDFLDDDSCKMKHLEAPRGAYKTSILQGFAMRMTLRNPNLRVLYGMDVASEAEKKMRFIRGHFQNNPVIELIWGKQRERGAPWAVDGFQIARRTRDVPEPTFSCFSTDRDLTGGHFDIIIPDDLVNHKNVKNEGIKKTLDVFDALFFLLDPGGWLIPTGTRYADDDLWGHIITNLSDTFAHKIISCGIHWNPDAPDDKPELIGEPTFKHLTKGFLLQQFKKLHYNKSKFSSQYMNTCLAEGSQLFWRGQFRPVAWDDSMLDLANYLLVDTATSTNDESCFSVGFVVGIDSRDDAYIIDSFCGIMDPHSVAKEIVSMNIRWQSKNPIKRTVLETGTANQVYKPLIEILAAQEQIRINIKDVPRGSNSDKRRERIPSLQSRFKEGKIHWVDTLPRMFKHRGEEVPFFVPDGWRSEDEPLVRLPAGEVVDQFIRFGPYGRDDIPDALADIEARDKKGFRICPPGSKRREDYRKQGRRSRGEVIPAPMQMGGRTQMVDVLAQREHNPGNSDSFLSNYRPGKA